jgi:hypothetical protein
VEVAEVLVVDTHMYQLMATFGLLLEVAVEVVAPVLVQVEVVEAPQLEDPAALLAPVVQVVVIHMLTVLTEITLRDTLAEVAVAVMDGHMVDPEAANKLVEIVETT